MTTTFMTTADRAVNALQKVHELRYTTAFRHMTVEQKQRVIEDMIVKRRMAVVALIRAMGAEDLRFVKENLDVELQRAGVL